MTASFFRFRGFTLVELIIVITILSILSVISFVAFRGFMSDARDSSRLSDITNIKKGLDIYITQTSKYPSPENQNGTGVINGQILTYVGEFGENNSKMVNFNKAIKDPLTKTSYIYGTISNQTEYQLATIIEGNITAYKPLGEITYADVTQARVDGNYKGYIKFNSGSDLYIANIPSLIFSNTGSVELLQSNTYYIVNKKQNLPYDDKGNKNNFLLTQKITSDSLIKDITKNPTSTLTGVKITNLTKDNFETIFTGDTLKSFNVAGIDVSNNESLKLTVKTGILGGGGISIPKTYATCSLSGQTINHGSSITAYSENNIVWNASYDCTNRSEIKTCNDGVLSGSGIYQYTSCIKGAVNNCSASGSYVYNTHTYSIPALNHGSGATNIPSSNVSENNGTFKYTLSSISCNDGILINPSESASKTLVSCNTNFHTEDNQTCISNTRTNQTCTGKPNNSVYNSATSITQTWNGTSWSPSTTAVWNTTTSTTDCRYKCNTNYTLNNGNCEGNSYTVTFDSQGGNTITSKSVIYGNTYGTLTSPIRTGYSFNGWFTATSGGTQVTESTNVTSTSNHTLYAQWIVNFYLDSNGVTVKCPNAALGSTGVVNGKTYTAVGDGTGVNGIKNTGITDYTLLCTSQVTNMSTLFQSKNTFNQDISSWDISNVTNMGEMFNGASTFNQDISKWNTSKNTSIYNMFRNATSFNQDISSWNTSNVTNMSNAFYNADSFNQPIGIWNTSNVTQMQNLFEQNNGFNQNLNNWDTSKVTNITRADMGATAWSDSNKIKKSGTCVGLPSNAKFYGGTTSYSINNSPIWMGEIYYGFVNPLNAIYTSEASPTINTCQFKCDSGYHFYNGSCIVDSDTRGTSGLASRLSYPTITENAAIAAPYGFCGNNLVVVPLNNQSCGGYPCGYSGERDKLICGKLGYAITCIGNTQENLFTKLDTHSLIPASGWTFISGYCQSNGGCLTSQHSGASTTITSRNVSSWTSGLLDYQHWIMGVACGK